MSEVTCWKTLPLELQLHILSFLRFPYLLTLLEVPEFGDLLRLDNCKMLDQAHCRLLEEIDCCDDVLEFEIGGSDGMLYSYYDGVVRLRHDCDAEVWMVTLQGGDHLYHWIFDCEINDVAKLIYSKHCYQGKPVSIYYRTIGDCEDTLLRITYQEGRLDEILYHDENLLTDNGGYKATLHTRAQLKMSEGRDVGALRGAWEALLRRGKRHVAVASRIYQSECTTIYFRNVLLVLQCIDRDYGPKEQWPYMVRLASSLVPSFPLLLAKVATSSLVLPFQRLGFVLEPEDIVDEAAALRSLTDDLEMPAWPELGKYVDPRYNDKVPRRYWPDYI